MIESDSFDLLKMQEVVRGSILSNVVDIERLLDQYLADYFCSTKIKSVELKENLLWTERINFDFKREIFSTIITKHNNSFLAKNPKILEDLSSVAPVRNVFAHLEIDKEGSTNHQLIFKKYTGGKLKSKKYSLEELFDFEAKCIRIKSILARLIITMPSRNN